MLPALPKLISNRGGGVPGEAAGLRSTSFSEKRRLSISPKKRHDRQSCNWMRGKHRRATWRSYLARDGQGSCCTKLSGTDWKRILTARRRPPSQACSDGVWPVISAPSWITAPCRGAVVL